MFRFLGVVMMACVLSTPVAAADAQPALLGQSIAEAQKSELVQFFGLTKTNEVPDPVHKGFTLTVFGAEGRFKGAVNLLLATKDGSDKVVVATLMLRRDFIDGATAPFARDVAKSFLATSPGIGAPDIAALHDDIRKGCAAGTERYVSNGKDGLTKAPCAGNDKASPAYLTYLGRQEKQRLEFAGGYVMLQNTDKILNTPLLLIETGPR